MKITKTALKDVLILEPRIFYDDRGYFFESFNRHILVNLGINIDWVQDNHSFNKQSGTLRGLHYQLNPTAQTKLVRIVKGSVLDVAVDIRPNSSTYGQHVSVELTEHNHKQLLIPKGFAHGFITLEPDTLVLYKTDEYYSHTDDRSILWNDPDLKIDWGVNKPILSNKDTNASLLRDADNNF